MARHRHRRPPGRRLLLAAGNGARPDARQHARGRRRGHAPAPPDRQSDRLWNGWATSSRSWPPRRWGRSSAPASAPRRCAWGTSSPRTSSREVWRTWWLSDFSGALVVTPLILTWATRGLSGLSRWDLVEGAVLIAALVLLAELPSQRDVPYVVFPVLIWAALRFGPRGAATALVLVSGLTVWNTAHNAGPFVRAVDHRQPALEPALPGHRGADGARARRGDGRARSRRRGAARQRGAIALGRAIDGGGPHRP